MTKERLKSPRVRLFVALDLPDDVRDGLAAWQRESLGDPALRALGEDQLHVTLCFLGYHPERRIERIAELVCETRARPVTMRFEPHPVAVPRNRPRLYAVGGESEAAVELQMELAAALEPAGFYSPEKGPFWPHVTVARVRPEKGSRGQGGRRGRGRPQAVETPPEPLPDALLEPFEAVRVALYRSNLRPAGAEYVSLAEFDLPPSRAEKR